MSKQNARNTNRYHLPRGHDDGEYNRSKLFYGSVNEQLSGGRGNRRDDIVLEDTGIDPKEFNDFGNISIQYQSRRRHDNCRTVDPQHHLVGVDIGPSILDIDLVLPLRCEAIEHNVHAHEEQTDNLCGGIMIGGFAGNAKYGHTDGN